MENEILKYIILNPIPFLIFLVILFYFSKELYWHAIYFFIILTFGYVAIQTVGMSEFLVGIIVGVIANGIFGFIKEQLVKEN